MRRFNGRHLLLLFLVSLLAGWLWWVTPTTADMSKYAPADALFYLEANQPLEVAETIARTDTWKALESISGYHGGLSVPSKWVQGFVRLTGIGPIQSVILARSQLAVVITELSTTEQGDTLRIKPEGAAIIETHTASWRIRPQVEHNLQELAEVIFRQPTVRKSSVDGLEFIEWTAPEGSRQIVATIIGSIVIVGNSEHAVQHCVAVCLKRQPSLQENPELNQVRLQVAARQSLAFGLVPSAKSARLLAVGVQLMLGRTTRESEFQRLMTASAAKVFGSVGWSTRAFMSGIEDRYVISLAPSITGRLKSNFAVSTSLPPITQVILPDNVHSVTYYDFENPEQTWQGLKTAVSSQIDALSAIVFSSLLRSALLNYGIEEPERFLGVVGNQILTMRLDENGERSVLIANVRDQLSLRNFVNNNMLKNARSLRMGKGEILEDSRGQTAVAFVNEFVVTGTPAGVREYVAFAQGGVSNHETLRRLTFFAPHPPPANIVSYVSDGERVRAFMTSILLARSSKAVPSVAVDKVIDELPYSATITTLNERGVERITRSPLGQFSVFLPLLLPDPSSGTSNITPAK